MTSEEFAPLLGLVARNLGVSVRVSEHDPQEWQVAAVYDGPGTIVRLGSGGAVTLLRSFSPFETGLESEFGARERRRAASRVLAIARSIDPQVAVEWPVGDATAVLKRRVGLAEVTEAELTRALAMLEDVVESCREDASAVAQGVAEDALPVDPTPPPRRPIGANLETDPHAPEAVAFSSQLIPAIVTTMLCPNPLSIISIVFAVRAQSLANGGDYAAAEEAARKARTFWILAVVVVVVGMFGMCSCQVVRHSGF